MRHFTAAIAAALLLLPSIAQAGFLVRSPTEIDYGEFEFEHNGTANFDRRPDQRGARTYTLEFGTGVTPWWKTELEISFERGAGPGQSTLLNAIVTENIFQLTQPGEYWADFGFYFEYGQSLTRGRNAGPNAASFGPLISKDIGRTTHTLNVLFTRQLGPNQTSSGLNLNYAWQSRWNVWEALSPAFEIYGDAGVLGRSPRLSQQQLLAGPVAVGAIRLADLGLQRPGKIKYQAGYLFGATQASTRGTLRWRLELEIPF